jgi:hypothetical protein
MQVRSHIPLLATEHDRAAVLDRATVAAFGADLLNAGAKPAIADARYRALRPIFGLAGRGGETDQDGLLGSRPPNSTPT